MKILFSQHGLITALNCIRRFVLLKCHPAHQRYNDMAAVSIELAREYLRLLEGEDDTILSFLIDAAEAELKESGVVIEDNESFLSMYRLAVLLHVSMHYENRSAAVNVEKLSVSYNNLLLKLKKMG